MKKISTQCVLLVLAVAFISGCVGKNRVLFMTKTNIGLDIDTEPPTAEITIARREIAIQPIFPNNSGKQESALPLLGSFGLTGSFFTPKITGHFAGGDAAIFLAQEETAKNVDSTLYLDDRQTDSRGPLRKFWHWIKGKSPEEGEKEPRAFYFATDSSYGLKVAWSGTGGSYPDSLKLGYNRKEFASAPVLVDKDSTETSAVNKKYRVKLPSFYAATDNTSNLSRMFEDTGVSHVQFFATGKAATEFAKRSSVRKIAFENMAPDAAAIENSSLNQALIDEIKGIFDNADDPKKSKILEKAKELKLVKDNTNIEKLPNELQKNSEKSSPSIPNNLNSLRRFAQSNQ